MTCNIIVATAVLNNLKIQCNDFEDDEFPTNADMQRTDVLQTQQSPQGLIFRRNFINLNFYCYSVSSLEHFCRNEHSIGHKIIKYP